MAPFSLGAQERVALEQLLRHGFPARALCRAQALLWLADGESAADVADTLGVEPRTVYYWTERFQQREDRGILTRLSDAPRSGRPRSAMGVIDPIVDEIIDSDPRELGYYYTGWTAALLQDYLLRHHNIQVSLRSIGSAIHRIRVGWKHPRYRLALRPKHWQQSKGGSKRA
jgi:transposase